MTSSRRVWRGGMVGAGVWSKVQLAAWAGVPNARIVALCDRQPEPLHSVAASFNIPNTFEDVQAMLAGAELDFVDICTRPASHAPLIRIVAERGLPVLCQKPFCTSLAEAQSVVKLADEAGARLMVNENWRWQAWYRQVKECLASGTLGRPFLARLHKRVRMTLPAFEHAQAYLAEMPRLLAYEMGVHYLDTFRYLFGEPQHLYARLHRVSPHIRGEDAQVIVLDYGDMTGLVTTSWASVPVPGHDTPSTDRGSPATTLLEIEGSCGTLVLNAAGALDLHTDTGHQHWDFGGDVWSQSHVAALQHFVNCLEQGAEFETSGAETLKTMALVYACYDSAEAGQVMAVDDEATL